MSLRIAVTGSTGLIGTCVSEYFFRGHSSVVLRCVRPHTSLYSGADTLKWDPALGMIERDRLEGLDVFIHLSGAPIAARRWTRSYKEEILKSRCDTTRFVVDTFQQLKHPPKLFVCASACGYYGYRSCTRPKDEASPSGDGFLADVCRQWEEQAFRARDIGIRTVCARFGVVLSEKGGMLSSLYPAFRMGLGAVPGSGVQPLNWIALSEIPLMIQHLISHAELDGPINFVAPQTSTQEQFCRSLAKVLGRSCFFKAPAPVLKLALGKMAGEVLLDGCRVKPARLLESGYLFKHEELEKCLKAIFCEMC